MGRRSAGAAGGRRGVPADGDDAAAVKPASRSKGPSPFARKQGAPWPWWAVAVGGLALLLCVGRVLVPSEQGGGGRKRARRPASDDDATGHGKVSTVRLLELTLRLQEMTRLATTLAAGADVDAEAVEALDEELRGIEGELAGDGGSDARDIRSMIAVVRGTLYQRSAKLTDAQVEARGGNSFTYANPRYWEDYYQKTGADEKYDWYGSWSTRILLDGVAGSTFGGMLSGHLRYEDRILMLGCGNSDLSEHMYSAGYEGIVNIDVSARVVELLRERLSAAMPRMRWLHMDASALDFEAAEFDVVLDKGTLDAIEANGTLLQAAVAEAHKVLRPGGRFFSVTFNDATKRVESQLRSVAQWDQCSSYTFERSGITPGREQSRFHLHICGKAE